MHIISAFPAIVNAETSPSTRPPRNPQRIANSIRMRLARIVEEMAACIRLGARHADNPALCDALLAEFNDLHSSHYRLSQSLAALEAAQQDQIP